MRKEEIASWDGGKSTWGGRVMVFGTVLKMSATIQGMSSVKVEQIVAQQVTNAIEAIAIYVSRIRMAHDSTVRTVLLASSQSALFPTSQFSPFIIPKDFYTNLVDIPSICFPALQIGPVHIWLRKVVPLLVAFDSQMKIFHTSLNDDASCKHPKRDVKSEAFLNAVPFHNLEIRDENDPPLGVYIESRFPVNSEPVELLTCCVFATRGTSSKILEVVVDEVCKGNYMTTLVIRYQWKRL
nr:hypothetical protein [Tanacetum cinerariifolium]